MIIYDCFAIFFFQEALKTWVPSLQKPRVGKRGVTHGVGNGSAKWKHKSRKFQTSVLNKRSEKNETGCVTHFPNLMVDNGVSTVRTHKFVGDPTIHSCLLT